MRFTYSSLDRAAQAARRLDAALEGAGRPTSLTETRRALAVATGYRTWAELKLHHGRGPNPTPFDEGLGLWDLAVRLSHQAKELGAELDIPHGKAADLVAEARLTAHPAGPHVLDGPSSSVSSAKPDWCLAFRGVHPELGPLAIRNGRLEPILNRNEVAQCLNIRERMMSAKGKGRGSDAYVGSVNFRIFMHLEELGVETDFTVFRRLHGDIQGIALDIMRCDVERTPADRQSDLAGRGFIVGERALRPAA
jgi:hypothetical protein